MSMDPDQAHFIAVSLTAIMAREMAKNETELLEVFNEAFEQDDQLSAVDVQRVNAALADLSKELALRARQMLARHQQYALERARSN